MAERCSCGAGLRGLALRRVRRDAAAPATTSAPRAAAAPAAALAAARAPPSSRARRRRSASRAARRSAAFSAQRWSVMNKIMPRSPASERAPVESLELHHVHGARCHDVRSSVHLIASGEIA